MENPESPLVVTKIRLPARRPHTVARPRLAEFAGSERGKDLILVSAPAGYGKTTLLVDWAQSLQKNGLAVAWYALDASDDDPLPFSAYLVASLSQAFSESRELAHLAQRLRGAPEIDLQMVMQAIINAIASSTRNGVQVLDDYHLISSPAIHSAIAFLLEHLPQNLRIIIGSRSDPPLPLARWRARGRLLEVRSTDLRFTTEETEQFLNEAMKLDLSSEGIIALERRTEGWITGLQLAALSLVGRADKETYLAAFSGSHRYLVEYLLEEVVSRQTEEVQSFLAATSILERLCASLCNAISDGKADSEAILKQLDQDNLFLVALDEQGTWYRYHHLFRDFLQTRLRKNQPERIASLQRIACQWLAKHNFLREAAQHAFQTGDWEYAAAFVEEHSFTMIIHSDIATIYKWCSAFPEEVMRRHPFLCIHQCWALVFSFRRQNRTRIEERLRQVDLAISAMTDRQQVHIIQESAAVVRSFLAMAPDQDFDPRQQLALAQGALKSYPEGDAGRFSALLSIGYAHLALQDALAAGKALESARQIAVHERLFFGIVESTFHLARLAHSQGQLNQAVELCRRGQTDLAAVLSHPEQELSASGGLDIALGCVLLEQDRLDEAERLLLHGLELSGVGTNPYYLMTAHIALHRLYGIRNRPEEMATHLTRLEEISPDLAFFTNGLRSVNALKRSPKNQAIRAETAAWCQEFSSPLREDVAPPGLGPFGAAEIYYLAYLAWIQIQIETGNPQNTMPILERMLALSETHRLTNRIIELSLLEARAAQAQGNQQKALNWLERAMLAGQPVGYLRIFDQDPILTRLLVQAADEGICRDYVERILAVIGEPKSIGSARTTRVSQKHDLEITERLSQRELDVLRLMAEGCSNQAIADRLVITVGTVKSHINHILGKMGAANRTEAVTRAHNLGLIDL